MTAKTTHDPKPTPSSTQPQHVSVTEYVANEYVSTTHAPALLKPKLGFWSVTALGVVTTATWASYASTLVTGLTAGGPVSLLYGFVLAASMGAATCLSLAECAGIWTTAGGQVDWVYMMSPDGWAPCLSYATGWLSTVGMALLGVGGQTIASQGILAMAQLSHPGYVIAKWHVPVVGWVR